jgi:tetratricopeptide (TPR) repeat protein
LVFHRGNCAGLTALVLAVAERVKVPMEAVVFPRHVVVRAPGDIDRVFELLSRGASLSMTQLRMQLGAEGAHDTRVRSGAFPAFYLDNFAVRFGDTGDDDRAEVLFAKAVEAAPRAARIRFDYGTFLLGRDRPALAEGHLRRAVRLDPRSAPAWANLGVARARLGETAEARRCFERALRFDPGNGIAAENLRTLSRDGPRPPR